MKRLEIKYLREIKNLINRCNKAGTILCSDKLINYTEYTGGYIINIYHKTGNRICSIRNDKIRIINSIELRKLYYYCTNEEKRIEV